ncbi:hypothetical protein [Oleiharenicola lentus]|uniref:hypothetical protein n=1 Tax=Oleiharenicola lentus TaxID=2508720 RepID=UPI003F676960
MLNLAAIRYRNVLVSRGGPIARIELGDTMVMGRRQFLANAFLAPNLAVSDGTGAVFSQANGSGTSEMPMMARFMAISEALERWAHWQLHADSEGKRYGFDIDPSSNGMAAFPGLFARQARASALMEAAERFNLMHWWEGRLTACDATSPWPDVQAATICSEAPGITVIIYQQLAEGGFAYGHAAALDFGTACWKAAIEMERHAQAIRQFALTHAGGSHTTPRREVGAVEQRSLFFATQEGHELFKARLHAHPISAPAIPKLVYDGPVPGPWSRYADVWRVVYAPPSDRYLSAGENYFLW